MKIYIDGELPRHNPKEAAEDFRDNRYPDCKVVKVEIREVEECD